MAEIIMGIDHGNGNMKGVHILVGMCVNNDYELSEDAKACAHSYRMLFK